MKITYIFGAGASCGALPMVGQIPDRINLMVNLLEKEHGIVPSKEWKFQNKSTTYGEILEKLIAELKWLTEHFANHASIDTFAKKLTIRRQWDDLQKLKRAFSAYFTLEQIISPVEKRYDSFFASILNEDGELPKNVRILSWNYDFQFEKAYSEYSELKHIDRNRHFLNVIQKKTRGRESKENFCLIKLNGSCSIIESSIYTHEFCDPFECGINPQILEHLLGTYHQVQLFPGLKSALSFAWEKEDTEIDIVNYSVTQTHDTEVVVFIGYSMPYFNREIDRKIIRGMKNLQKVYFQSPKAESLKERFLTLRTDVKDLVSVNDLQQFYLPGEL